MRAIDLLRGITKAKLPRVEARSWPVQQRRRLVRRVAELALEVGGGLLGEPRVPRDGRARRLAALADLALVRFQSERAQILEKRRTSPGNDSCPDECPSAPVVLDEFGHEPGTAALAEVVEDAMDGHRRRVVLATLAAANSQLARPRVPSSAPRRRREHLRTGFLAAAVARGQEPLALPAPLPVFIITGPQLERDAPLLIIVFSFVFISYSHYILMLIIEESLRLRPSKVSPDTFRANVADTTLPELIRDMSCK